MASPNISLGSLSSPSPTPSPPPPSHLPHNSSTARTEAPSGGHPPAIDTDSELSELTDDDQDASTAAEKRAASTATASSSKGKGGAVIDDDDDPSASHSGALVGSPLRMAGREMQRLPANSLRRGGRRKRSSIVPAPMWGWVPEKTSTNTAVVEEEEEEMSGPPRAMEEEEEEEDEEDEDDEEVPDAYDAYDHGDDSGEAEGDVHASRPFGSHRRQGSYQSKHLPGPKKLPARSRRPASASRRNVQKYDDDYEDDDPEEDNPKSERRPRQSASGKRIPPKHGNGDDRPIANGEDDEGSASGGSEYLSTKRRKLARPRLPTSNPRRKKESGNDNSSGSDIPLSPRKANGVKSQHEEDPEDEDAGTASQGEEDNTDSEADPPPEAPIPHSPISPSKLSGLKSIVPSTEANSSAALSALAALANAVDPVLSPTREAVSITAAAASASILVGAASTIPVPQSGATSEAGTRDPSPSRSSTPTAKSTAEDSADESKPSKSKPMAGKAAPRAGKSKPRGKVSAPDKKDPPAANDDPAKLANGAKKGPPTPLDIQADSAAPSVVATGNDMNVDEEDTNDHSMEDPDVEMDPAEHDDEEDEEENDGAGEINEDDEEPEELEHADEEAVEADPEGEGDGEEEVNDADDDGADQEGEGEGDEEHDQEQDNEQDAAEVQHDNEEGEDADNDEEHTSQNGDADADVDVEDHESDLQPAHRAEALDVLATIELKFALLRERVYVEKMEALAWEEMLVQNALHPELQHLQKELSKRRDKRLELASRKRSYEVANAVTRRNADESNIWSWWQFTRDDLQTEMIAETSRKRRKLERERRAIERPQPIRRIPYPMDVINPPLPPPSLRKIIKAYPFGSRKHNKSDAHHHHHHHHHHSHYPKNLVYPEISTLSASDIQSDLDFLFQNRRNSGYEQQQQQLLQQPHYPSQLQRNGSMMSSTGMGRPNLMSNGFTPSMQAPPSMGPMPPPPHPQQHGMGYEPYSDITPSFGPSGAPGRVRDPYAPQGPGGSMSGPPGSSRDGMNAYSNYPGATGRFPPPQHGPPMAVGPHMHHGYSSDHEMSTMAPGGPSNGGGHQLLPNHPYFGQGSMGPGPPSSSHMSGHHPGTMKGGIGMNVRRSVSPVQKANGWMGMRDFQGGSGVKGGEWDARMMHEDEERERALRERDRKRDEREIQKEKEQQRDREMERARREREFNDQERDRQREHQHMQQMSHRQPSIHGSTPSHTSLPPQGSGANPHHLHNHHHHRIHHHHVLHHHHPQQGSQHTPSMPLPGAAPPIVHSPRSTREYESSRPPHQGPMHTGPGQPHTTELIMLSSGDKRQPPGHWPSKIGDEPPHHSLVDYRDRDREVINRERSERDSRKMQSGRQSTGPMPPFEDRGDRPMAMPFVMASSHTMQQTSAGMSSSTHINGSGLSSSTSSPRGAPSWSGPGGMDDSYRMSSSAPPPSGYMGSPHDTHIRSPVQGHRYATSSEGHAPAPLGRMGPSSSSSSMHHRMASPPPPPPRRARPPQSPSYPPASTVHRSPVTSPKMRALSPVPSSSASKHISGTLPGPGYSSSPHLSGPGRTTTPTGHHQPPLSSGPPSSMQDVVMKNGALPPYNGSSRMASPLMSSLQGSGRPPVNGASGSIGDRDRNDRDRDHPSPRLGASVPLAPPPSKLSTAQMVDGH